MLVANISRVILKILFFVLFSHLLAPREFGIFGIAFAIIQFAMLFSDLGIAQSLIQKTEVSNNEISSGHYFAIGVGLTVFLVIAGLAPLASVFFDHSELQPVLSVLSLVFVLRSMCSVPEALLIREMRFKLIATRETAIYFIANLLVGIPLAFTLKNVWCLVWMTLASETIRTGVILFAYPMDWKARYSFSYIQPLLRYGAGMSGVVIINRIALNVDNLVVGKLLGLEMLGYYSRAYQLVAFPANVFGDTAAKVFFPLLSKIKDDPKRLKGIFLRTTHLLSSTILPASFIIAVLSEKFIPSILGKTWEPVILPFQLLSFGMFFRVCYKIVSVIAKSTGTIRGLLYTQVIYATMVTMGSIVGSSWNIEGVAVGVLVALLVNYLSVSYLGLLITDCSIYSWLKSHILGILLLMILIVSAPFFDHF
jgi:O-antigen/teichoic acid export membrane protein